VDVMNKKNNKKSENIFSGLSKSLKAKVFYNPELKIISYDDLTKGSNASKTIWEYIVDKFDDNNSELRRVNALTAPITNLAKLKGLYLEKRMGYKRI